MEQRITFLDVETGGLNPNRHAIIQLAAVAVDAEFQEVDAFEVKLRFSESSATRANLRKNHYSRSRWAREAVEPVDAARNFAAFLRRHASVPTLCRDGKIARVAQLVAHNAAFDGPFLCAWYERLGIYLPARFQMLCTLQRSLWFFAERPHLPLPDNFKLATLCRYFQVPLHPQEAHEALADVRATIGLYKALSDRRTAVPYSTAA